MVLQMCLYKFWIVFALSELDAIIYSENVVLFNNLWKGLMHNVEKESLFQFLKDLSEMAWSVQLFVTVGKASKDGN